MNLRKAIEHIEKQERKDRHDTQMHNLKIDMNAGVVITLLVVAVVAIGALFLPILDFLWRVSWR